MFKYYDDVNKVDIFWTPIDTELGVTIVKEVTGLNTSVGDVAEVNNEAKRVEIYKLYAERNTDINNDVIEESVADELKKELGVANEKINNLEQTIEVLENVVDELIFSGFDV